MHFNTFTQKMYKFYVAIMSMNEGTQVMNADIFFAMTIKNEVPFYRSI